MCEARSKLFSSCYALSSNILHSINSYMVLLRRFIPKLLWKIYHRSPIESIELAQRHLPRAEDIAQIRWFWIVSINVNLFAVIE